MEIYQSPVVTFNTLIREWPDMVVSQCTRSQSNSADGDARVAARHTAVDFIARFSVFRQAQRFSSLVTLSPSCIIAEENFVIDTKCSCN